MTISASFIMAVHSGLSKAQVLEMSREELGDNGFGIVGALSGIVEPAGGALVILIAAAVTPAMPVLLAFAAGAMLYVVVEECGP